MSNAPDILLIGAGGHAHVLIDALSAGGDVRRIGILDADERVVGKYVLNIQIVGTDRMLEQFVANGTRHFAIAVGANNRLRAQLFQKCLDAGLSPLTIIHPSAIVSRWAKLGDGAQLLPRSVVNAGAALGVNVIVNTGAIVEHDCVLGDHVHISSNACLAGGVVVGDMAHVGAGAVIRQLIRVGHGATIGIGAAVVNDIPPLLTVAGVPAKEISR